MNSEKRGSFTGGIGFVLAAAGSAVGLGNIWRFPYLAAKEGGGIFLLVYLILVLTFGFTLLTTEIAIGRLTRQGPLTAYGRIHAGWRGIGVMAWLVPIIILPYYCAIGGWVVKYLVAFLTGSGTAAAQDGYFTEFITGQWQPIVWLLVFLGRKRVHRISRCGEGHREVQPDSDADSAGFDYWHWRLFTDAEDHGGGRNSSQRSGRPEGICDSGLTGMTLGRFVNVLIDAMGQLFFSISVAMGIMVAYGSYAKKETNLVKSINQIEFFDTLVAFLAGLMIIPAVYTFMGMEGMSAGPGLMFVSLPKVFEAMGGIGNIIGFVFFLMVIFAAVTSAVSIMEAIVSGLVDHFHFSRHKSTVIVTAYAIIGGIIVCLGYNLFYFELKLPNGTVGQILDLMDYISNNFMMPIVAILTCILIGWVAKPKTIIDEVIEGGYKFSRKNLYIVMIRYIAPALLLVLLLQSMGILNL